MFSCISAARYRRLLPISRSPAGIAQIDAVNQMVSKFRDLWQHMLGRSGMVRFVVLLLAGLTLAGCAGSNPFGSSNPGPSSAPAPSGSAPPAQGISNEDLVGRWGFASFHNEPDRARTTAQARSQCGNPYVINRGPNGGVMMHLPDQSAPAELRTKGGPGGKRYLGPDGPAGDSMDREFVTFEGSSMSLRWVDPEVAGRYGVAIYVRCGVQTAGPRPAGRRTPPAGSAPAAPR
jgi:hypothetical protein